MRELDSGSECYSNRQDVVVRLAWCGGVLFCSTPPEAPSCYYCDIQSDDDDFKGWAGNGREGELICLPCFGQTYSDDEYQ